VRTFIHDNGWFLGFWSTVALLCVVERLWPRFDDEVDRRHRWTVNFGLGIGNGVIASIVPALTVLPAIWAADRGVGALNLMTSRLWLAIPAVILVRSFAQYCFHRCCHAQPLLWRLHRVHHCDTHLDVSSALRFHPVEMLAMLCFTVPFVVAFGLPPAILAAYEAIQLVMGLLTHANIRLPRAIERGARLLVMTPALHRFHHSAEQPQTDRNYGDVFSVWDRLFGTLLEVPLGTARPARFGLDDVSAMTARDFWSQLLLPLQRPGRRTSPLSDRSAAGPEGREQSAATIRQRWDTEHSSELAHQPE
jgi:sterol desaturase/sphingolipid hydroxylase (fatty acid hydroxylase superfamily)